MKSHFILFFFLLSGLVVHGQSVDYQGVIEGHFELNDGKSTSQDGFSYRVLDGYLDQQSGYHFVYVHQHLNGVRVRNQISVIILDQKGNVVLGELSDFSTTKNAVKQSSKPKITANKALALSLVDLQVEEATDVLQLKSSGGKLQFESTQTSEEVITSELIYVKEKDNYKLCWETAVFINEFNEWWQVRIDASSGAYIDRNTWTLSCFNSPKELHDHSGEEDNDKTILAAITEDNVICDSSYNVFDLPAEHPEDGSRTLVSKPWLLAPVASPQGWHQTSITEGNNVYAYEDMDANNVPGNSADGGITLCFDFPLDLNDAPASYVSAAITNLFYINNKIHDIMYGYGFDEAAGNFQNDNPTGAGVGGDYVLAETQNGLTFNQANFSTPPEGTRPRMQMFNWVLAGRTFSINTPEEIAGNIASSGALFGPQGYSLDGFVTEAVPSNGCTDLTNPTNLIGKVAMIDRGGCSIVDKAIRAQAAGAIALIVCQYDSISTLVTLGGNPNTQIDIPSVMISGQYCDTIRMALDTSDVKISIASPTLRDSDLDNVVVIHEYAHGISTRLTGGPLTSDCLGNQEQMGEGWSDWYALMLTMKSTDTPTEERGIGTYLLGETNNGRGLRQYPYSTDLTTNPSNYNDLPNAFIPHGVGQLWASMLWEVTWELIGVYGFDADMYNGQGGNNIALELVTMALKIQPCSPGFVDGRNALLDADLLLNGGIHQCMIWSAFAKRGLGYSASQGSVDSLSDGSAAIDMPPLCTMDYIVGFSADKSVVSLEDTLIFDIVITGYQDVPTADLILQDSLGEDLILVNGSLNKGTSSGSNVDYTDVDFSADSVVRINYKSQFDTTVNLSTLVYYEGVESGQGLWTVEGSGPDVWQVNSDNPHQGQNAFYAPGNIGNQDHFLISPILSLTGAHLMSFWHSYDMETNWDGGLVELQVVGTSDWIDLEDYFVQNGYSHRLINSSNPLIEERMAFSGKSGGYVRSWIDLSVFAGLEIRVRFFHGSDAFASGDGWYIDDIAFYKAEWTKNYLTVTYGSTILRDTLIVYSIPVCLPCEGDIVCDGEVLVLDSVTKSTYRAGSGIVLNNVGSTGAGSHFLARDSVVIYPMIEVKKDSILIIQIEGCIDP